MKNLNWNPHVLSKMTVALLMNFWIVAVDNKNSSMMIYSQGYSGPLQRPTQKRIDLHDEMQKKT